MVGTGQTWGGGRWSVDANNTLTIRGVKREDQGYYVCSAVGVAGSALVRAHLEVQDLSDLPPPIIALGASNQTLPLDTEGEMPCEARGTPEPSVVWERAGKTIQPDERTTITPLGTLRIKSEYGSRVLWQGWGAAQLCARGDEVTVLLPDKVPTC